MPTYEVIDKAVSDRAIAAFDGIQSAIIEKGVPVPAGTAVELYPDKIRAIETGGGGAPVAKAVNFLDFDGTLIAGWTIAEAQAATTLPTPPTHARLIFQGWNFTLEQVNALTMPMFIGAMYVTASGASEFDITVTTVTTTAVTVRIQNVSGNLTINWGDGTADYTSSGAGLKTASHTYAANGNYIISVDSTGTYYPYGATTSPYNMFNVGTSYICTSARLGTRCTSISSSVFRGNYSLTSVTIPNSVTSIGTYVFHNCYSLTSVTIPNSVTSIDGNAFYSCYSLTNIMIPNSVTSIGSSAFYQCYSLTSVTIPNSVTNIGSSAFATCHSILSYFLLRATSPTIPDPNAFTNINDICIIWVPLGSGAAYKATTNWTTYANHIYEMTTEQYAKLAGGAR